MAISKRLRMEILRRDNHTCRYCGGTAPDVRLTIDHVTPVTLGGTDDPGNLVAACADCNAGKSSIAPDSSTVDDVAQDALRWADAMRLAAEASSAESRLRQERNQAFCDYWLTYFEDWRGGPKFLPDAWAATVDQFHAAGATSDMLMDAIDATAARNVYDPWRYFCGVMWKKIGQLQDRARAILLAGGERP